MKLVSVISLFLFSLQAYAWKDHHLVTRSSLWSLDVAHKTVEYKEFEVVLGILKLPSQRAFNEYIKIRKDFVYNPELNEIDGKHLRVLDILSKYSDEPDWNMDIELFDEDQYPNLWKNEYKFMGGKKGTPSQAHRHMYWSSGKFKLPKVFKPMGIAHERFELFVKLSQLLFEADQPYWGVRFLANALHYVEDVANPFHSTQIPTMKMLIKGAVCKEKRGRDIIGKTTKIVSYYHFAFERYISELMGDAATGKKSEEGWTFIRKLAEGGKPFGKYSSLSPSQIVVDVSSKSAKEASRAGKASMKFFPPIRVACSEFDPKKTVFSDPNWWNETIEIGKSDSEPKTKYFSVVNEMFESLGATLRSIVSKELQSL